MTVYDSTWKDALDTYFEAFMELLFPDVHAVVDWRRPVVFRDKELQKLDPRGASGVRTVDKLVEVHRTDGTDALLYIHVEVQSQPQAEFARRMFVYHYRLFDKYQGQVVSLAVLADDTPHWRPDGFENNYWGCRIRFEFPIVKLLDFERGWDDLIASENPFAVVVQAHLKALGTRGRPLERKEWKLAIIRRLYDRGIGRSEIRRLFRFIDGLMTLPKDLDSQFVVELGTMEEEKNMTYVTSVERVGLRRGRKEGQLEMARESILDALETRFDMIPETVRTTIQSLERVEICRSLHREAILADSVRDFEARLAELTADGN